MQEGQAGPQLRPLGVGEILDAAFKMYRAHFKTLCLCLLVLTVPGTIIQTLVTLSADPDAFRYDKAFDPSATSTSTEIDTTAAVGQGIGALILSILVVASIVALLHAVSAAYLGDKPSWRSSLAFGFRKLPRILMITLLWFLIFIAFWTPVIGLGVVAPITLVLLIAWIPLWIWLMVRLVMALPVGLIEDLGGANSFGRSFKLVEGRWWPTFGTLAIMYILTSILQAVLVGLLIAPVFADSDNELLAAALTTVGNILSYTLTLPLFAAAWVISYYDLRVRKEGLDLALLAQRFGVAAPVAESTGLGGGLDLRKHPEPQPQTFGGFASPRPTEERDTT